MKNVRKTFAMLLIVFCAAAINGQIEGVIYDLNLKGKWTASCPIEMVNMATIRSCELCPFIEDPMDTSQFILADVELNFKPDSITIDRNGEITTVPYIRNKDTHAVSFILNQKQYNFRVFLHTDQTILEDSDGLIVVLVKRN